MYRNCTKLEKYKSTLLSYKSLKIESYNLNELYPYT